ncbi:hypothetical protein THAOC_36845 [Thalassiosira oceanica]|uniref:DDE Tnp4 domain-containing protein n=1 Tax=Thalassiosira oceanica TaxID=159749 RepID=K0QZI6_THAOC|nr:hypothetical protein THAOC_36845 [Thalassiosira oceanica]|eukprot:EJK44605.1 hypothetical protein THAOC_36845 [Thalassiosira oceanica]
MLNPIVRLNARWVCSACFLVRRAPAGISSVIASLAASSAGLLRKRKADCDNTGSNFLGRDRGAKTIKRERLDMEPYIEKMEERPFRRKYRMSKEAFMTLFEIVKPHMPDDGTLRKRGRTPNGNITKLHRLSMALRYCAGGDPVDIADIHGVKDDEVLNSLWDVVDAIHQSTELDIKFPENEADQRRVAAGFRRKSEINIDCCVGAIDGILIWIHKPSTRDEKVIGIGPKKFFCGRKKKFGLNMQGVCDARGYFLDVEIRFPGKTELHLPASSSIHASPTSVRCGHGATRDHMIGVSSAQPRSSSDFYAFDESSLKKKLEQEGFLGNAASMEFGGKLCLFGDNAYVQSPYMCTPWKSVSSGPKDSFNFYHSQVRINIECAFGILVHRWGILRKAIPVGISVSRTTRLVLALCKLNNFCIANNEGVAAAYEKDVSSIVLDGGCPLPRMDESQDNWRYDTGANSADRLSHLLDGGDHRDDHSPNLRQRFRRVMSRLPCQSILRRVTELAVTRPSRSTGRMS